MIYLACLPIVFQTPGQAADQVERAALGAELVKLHHLEMREKTAASLIASVQHCALETKLRELEQQFKFRAAALRAHYLAAVLEIHGVATICYRQ